MAAYFFDIDGTLVEYHTNRWLPGALAHIIKLYKDGNQIHLITMRGNQDKGKTWSIEKTKETILADLDDFEVKYKITFGVSSPRILVDDSECHVQKRKQNSDWI